MHGPMLNFMPPHTSLIQPQTTSVDILNEMPTIVAATGIDSQSCIDSQKRMEAYPDETRMLLVGATLDVETPTVTNYQTSNTTTTYQTGNVTHVRYHYRAHMHNQGFGTKLIPASHTRQRTHYRSRTVMEPNRSQSVEPNRSQPAELDQGQPVEARPTVLS